MNITIFGTGTFGFAIAKMLHKNNHKITMWTHDAKSIDSIKKGKKEIIENYKLPDDFKLTSSYKEAMENAEIVFIIVAAQYIDEVTKNIKKYDKSSIHYSIGSKGIEQKSCKFVHEVFKNNIKNKNISVFSGPSFAIDVINNQPIAFAIASRNKKTIKKISETLTSDTIKLRGTKDIIGVEICGSIKNVIAIAAGILNGLGYEESTRSFLIVEAMHDIKNLIKTLGGKKKTILTYAGIGDLLLTCTSEKSRNYSYGILVGKGDKNKAKVYLENTTVEGYYTLKSIYTLLKRKKIDMPVIDLIYNIIMNGKNPALLKDFLINKK